MHDVTLDYGPIINGLTLQVTVNQRQQGYPKVAGFEDCDRTLLIFRKFGWLHVRLLLSLQDELAELETKLKRLDQWEFAEGDYQRLTSRRRDFQQSDSVRRELFEKIKAKAEEYGKAPELMLFLPLSHLYPFYYFSFFLMSFLLITGLDELLLRVQKIQSMRRPTTRAQTTLFNLIHNTESLVADEADFIRHSLDLASLVPGVEHGWFKGFLEDALKLISRRAAKVNRAFPHVI